MGSRLGALTAETPKPLLPVGGRPFAEWLVANLERRGIGDIIFTVGYRADAFESWVRGRTGGPAISSFVEETPLDTGGALSLLADRLDEHFFVLNGDTLFDAPFAELAALLSDSGAAAAMALLDVPDAGRYGRVRLEGSRVTSFHEKGGDGAGLINGGVYALTREAVIGRNGPFSLERELLPELTAEGRLAGMVSRGFFIDIGVPESFQDAQRSVPSWWAAAVKP